MLEMTLTRHAYSPKYTAGVLQIGNSRWETLEDASRKEKVKHHTSIPAGKYQIVPYVFSSVFQIRPLLKDVPNFTGIFIHPGNTADDSSGCILIGKSQSYGYLINSRVAYAEVCSHLCDAWGQKIETWIDIKDKENPPFFDVIQ